MSPGSQNLVPHLAGAPTQAYLEYPWRALRVFFSESTANRKEEEEEGKRKVEVNRRIADKKEW